MGAEQSGELRRGDVLFLPGASRVEGLRLDVGELVAPGRPVLEVSGVDLVVSADVDVDDRGRLGDGTEVTVVIPGGGEVPGTVVATNIVVVGQGGDMAAGDQSGGGSRVMQVEVALSSGVDDELVGAPVDVVVAIDERADVLAVPVTALLALSEGGYGLEVVEDDGTTRIRPVDTGMFAGGKVQVEGEGIAEGVVVGIAGR